MARDYAKLREEQSGRGSLLNFVRYYWHVLEPPKRQLVEGWPLEAIALHLEAVTFGDINRLLINVPPGFCKPQVVDTQVLTSRGRVRLDEVVVGDSVISHRGRFRKVTAVHKQGVLRLLAITTKNGRVTRPALDHPYLTTRGWVQAQHLVVGDVLGAVVAQEDQPAARVTPEEARLLGYFIGDGSCTHHPGFVNADQYVLSDFVRCAEACGLRVKVVPYPPSRPPGKATYLRVNGAKAFLERHGLLGKNSYTKRIPDAVLGSPRHIVANFIGAYWSCDGQVVVRHTGKRGSIYVSQAVTVGRDLANDLQHALLRLGINARIRERTRNLKTKRQNSGVYRYYHVQTVAHEDTVLFKDMPGLCPAKNDPLRNLAAQRFVQGPLFEDRIIAIKDGGSGECRCLTVEEDCSFTANDLAVHNSLMLNCFWPAWEWGPMNMPWLRALAFSYAQDLTTRDNNKLVKLVTSPSYRALWGERFTMIKIGEHRPENDQTGFVLATSTDGVSTGERGDRVRLDDPHNVVKIESDHVMEKTVRFFRESMSNRLNDENSAIVVCMQRVKDTDVSGDILSREADYCHLMIPMRFESMVYPASADGERTEDPETGDAFEGNELGWIDPRALDEDGNILSPREMAQYDGELAWPERFDRKFDTNIAFEIGDYGYCTPAESPVLMRDLSMRPIGSIQEGDEIIGFEKGNKRQRLMKATVKSISKSVQKVVKLHLSSGRVIRCTPNHKWYTGRFEKHRNLYAPAHVGSSLYRVCDPELQTLTQPDDLRAAGWLAGFFDGDGSATHQHKKSGVTACIISFTQKAKENLPICQKLEATLVRFGLGFGMYERSDNVRWYWLQNGNGSRQPSLPALQKFLHVISPTKWRDRIAEGALVSRFISETERVVAIEDDGEEVVYGLETTTGNYVVWGLLSSNSSQYQQSPVPRKGGIIKREYWQEYITPESGKFPDMSFVLVSVDTAFTEKEENDPTGCTTWGLWTDPTDGYPKLMLLAAWRKHLPIHGVEPEPRGRTETEEQYLRRCFPHWGIVEHVNWSCERFGGADVCLIEGRASGLDVINELRRIYRRAKYEVVPVNPRTDKYARAISVQPTFAQHLVYAPHRDWATMVKDECASFPKGRFKDLTDSTTQALRWLRANGMIHRRDEISSAIEEAKDYNVIRKNRPVTLYRA